MIDPFLVGHILGHYRIIERIGSGVMGAVYLAHDERLDRDVAVKVLPTNKLADELARKRFRKEALTLSKFGQTNIATIYDFDEQEGISFLVMEYVKGITLAKKIGKQALSEKEVLGLGAQIARLCKTHMKQGSCTATLLLLAAASGLRSSELLALRVKDVDFSAGRIKVALSSDQRSGGKLGPCKNAMACRTVHIGDPEGQKVMGALKRFLSAAPSQDALVFRSKCSGPLMETTVLNQGLYPALRALNLKKAGLHAFRIGCNRRWELAGIVPAVIRQQMGHTSAAMTRLYWSDPFEQIQAEFSKIRRFPIQMEYGK